MTGKKKTPQPEQVVMDSRVKEANELADKLFDSIVGHDVGAIITAFGKVQIGLYGNLGKANRLALREEVGTLQTAFARMDWKDLKSREEEKPSYVS